MLPPTATRTARPRQSVVNQSDCTVGYSVHISTSWSCHSIPPAGCEKNEVGRRAWGLVPCPHGARRTQLIWRQGGV